VILEAFEGPLDLLLYLIKRQNLDILDIPIAEITRQYIEYVELMKDLRLELAAEYLVMAAMLAEIKSRMLLPRPASEEGEEPDLPSGGEQRMEPTLSGGRVERRRGESEPLEAPEPPRKASGGGERKIEKKAKHIAAHRPRHCDPRGGVE